jgi:CHAP domain-containing protein/N-acetylmuramoyl-L-alanine amidase-like protein
MNKSFQIKAQSWLNSHVGGYWDVDGFPASQPYQCYDLANLYAVEIGGSGRFTGLYASDIIGQTGSRYRRINNSASFVPQLGDIMVWNRNVGGGYGHVAICTGEGDTNYFVSLDQNWATPKAVYVRHSYDHVIGVLRPIESEAAESAPVKKPTRDDEGIVQGQGLKARRQPNLNASHPWYFDDQESITLLARLKGQGVDGTWGKTDWWYLVRVPGINEDLFVSDGFVLTTKNPANVPDYKTAPPPPPEPKKYSFTKELDCVTEVIPAGIGNFEYGGFPERPTSAVIHDFGEADRDTLNSVINTFKGTGGRGVSAPFAVSGKRIIQFVSLKDRAYHAGAKGNDYIGIETDPKQDADTIESTKTLLRELRTKFGYTLKLIEHNQIMATKCGDDVDLAKYDISEAPPFKPNPGQGNDIRVNIIWEYLMKWARFRKFVSKYKEK